MILFKKNLLLVVLLLVAACSSIPKNTQNSCAIFEERYLWYKHAKASYEKWGAPIHLQLAFVKKESDFNWLCLLYTSPSPRDRQKSRMPSSA